MSCAEPVPRQGYAGEGVRCEGRSAATVAVAPRAGGHTTRQPRNRAPRASRRARQELLLVLPRAHCAWPRRRRARSPLLHRRREQTRRAGRRRRRSPGHDSELPGPGSWRTHGTTARKQVSSLAIRQVPSRSATRSLETCRCMKRKRGARPDVAQIEGLSMIEAVLAEFSARCSGIFPTSTERGGVRAEPRLSEKSM